MRKLLQNHKLSEPLIEAVYADRETEAQKGIFPEQKANDLNARSIYLTLS